VILFYKIILTLAMGEMRSCKESFQEKARLPVARTLPARH